MEKGRLQGSTGDCCGQEHEKDAVGGGIVRASSTYLMLQPGWPGDS